MTTLHCTIVRNQMLHPRFQAWCFQRESTAKTLAAKYTGDAWSTEVVTYYPAHVASMGWVFALAVLAVCAMGWARGRSAQVKRSDELRKAA